MPQPRREQFRSALIAWMLTFAVILGTLPALAAQEATPVAPTPTPIPVSMTINGETSGVVVSFDEKVEFVVQVQSGNTYRLVYFLDPACTAAFGGEEFPPDGIVTTTGVALENLVHGPTLSAQAVRELDGATSPCQQIIISNPGGEEQTPTFEPTASPPTIPPVTEPDLPVARPSATADLTSVSLLPNTGHGSSTEHLPFTTLVVGVLIWFALFSVWIGLGRTRLGRARE